MPLSNHRYSHIYPNSLYLQNSMNRNDLRGNIADCANNDIVIISAEATNDSLRSSSLTENLETCYADTMRKLLEASKERTSGTFIFIAKIEQRSIPIFCHYENTYPDDSDYENSDYEDNSYESNIEILAIAPDSEYQRPIEKIIAGIKSAVQNEKLDTKFNIETIITKDSFDNIMHTINPNQHLSYSISQLNSLTEPQPSPENRSAENPREMYSYGSGAKNNNNNNNSHDLQQIKNIVSKGLMPRIEIVFRSKFNFNFTDDDRQIIFLLHNGMSLGANNNIETLGKLIKKTQALYDSEIIDKVKLEKEMIQFDQNLERQESLTNTKNDCFFIHDTLEKLRAQHNNLNQNNNNAQELMGKISAIKKEVNNHKFIISSSTRYLQQFLTFLLTKDLNKITTLVSHKEDLSDILKVLLNKGANPAATNKQGENAFHLVAKWPLESRQLVEKFLPILVQKAPGALNAKDHEGNTPEQLAQKTSPSTFLLWKKTWDEITNLAEHGNPPLRKRDKVMQALHLNNLFHSKAPTPGPKGPEPK